MICQGIIIQTADGISEEEEKKLSDTEVQESADEKVKKISDEEDKKISDGEMKKEDQLSGTDVMKETTAMEYDTSNRLISYNGEKATYDKDGNMLHGPLAGQMADFTYDCRNRLTEIRTEDGLVTRYEYDAENQRIRKMTNVGTKEEKEESYIVDSASDELSQVLMKKTRGSGKNADTAGAGTVTCYIYGVRLAAQEASDYLLYHYNHVGSTLAVTDQEGTIRQEYDYSPYGRLLQGSFGTVDFLYNGQYGVASDGNGLYYMRARYYNVDILRFMNQDILVGSIGDSQSLNRYAYVEGNPVSFLDPFGLEKFDTSKMHEFLGNAATGAYVFGGIIALIGLGTGTTEFALLVALGTAITSTGAFVSGMNISYYVEDIVQSESKEDCKEYKEKIKINISTIITGIGVSVFGLENLVAVLADAVSNVISAYRG